MNGARKNMTSLLGSNNLNESDIIIILHYENKPNLATLSTSPLPVPLDTRQTHRNTKPINTRPYYENGITNNYESKTTKQTV